MSTSNGPQYVLNTRGRLKIHVDSPTPLEGLKYYDWSTNQDLGLVKTLRAFFQDGVFYSLEQILKDPTLSHTQIRSDHLKLFKALGFVIPREELAKEVLCTIPLTLPRYLPQIKPDPISALEINPFIYIQTSETLPPELKKKVRFHEHFEHVFPIVWVSDPLTQMVFPYQATQKWVQIIEQGDLHELSESEQYILQLANILVAKEELSNLCLGQEAHVNQKENDLFTHGHTFLSKVIPPLFLGHLRQYLKDLKTEGYYQLSDGQVKLRNIVHNEPIMQYLHHQISRYINLFLPERTKPSYTFLSAYLPGAILDKHKDREQCAWNISLVVDMEPELWGQSVWPIYLETDQVHPIHMELGDAIVYRGSEFDHWRDILDDEHYVTLSLFHFVKEHYKGVLD